MGATTLEEVRRKFRRCINEYNDPYGMYEEADDQEQNPGGEMGQIGGPEGEDPMAGAGGGFPGDQGPEGPDQGMQDGGMPQGVSGQQGGQVEKPEGFQPQGVDQNSGFEGMGGENQAEPDLGLDNAGGSDEEVIDVDDLTKSQEKTEEKVDDLTNKFGKVLSSLDDIIDRIDRVERRTSDNLDSIKREIEMRNPTPVQRMSMRTAKSAPYQVTPSQYMANDAPENYSPDDDNNGADDPQYTITNADIDNFTDYGSVSRQFDKGLSLNDILNF